MVVINTNASHHLTYSSSYIYIYGTEGLLCWIDGDMWDELLCHVSQSTSSLFLNTF